MASIADAIGADPQPAILTTGRRLRPYFVDRLLSSATMSFRSSGELR